jgi:2-dehydro-3-deoxy-D-arabinonate dehydratase
MRLSSVWDPVRQEPVLCSVQDGMLVPESATDVPLCSWSEVADAVPDRDRLHLLPPVRPVEVWAAGVTYKRSRDARLAESDSADCYQRVYDSERPELFLKATAARVVGPNASIGLRSDSHWDVPEPELAVVLGEGGTVLGYTLGNDVSSRDIEGANPLYLPQAKIFAGSCSLGPVMVTPDAIPNPTCIDITLTIRRDGQGLFRGSISTAEMKASIADLITYLKRSNWLPVPTVLLTGTGIVPPDDISLRRGDVVEVSSPAIGTLRNTCLDADELTPPRGWYATRA